MLFFTLTTVGSGLHVLVSPLKARVRAGSDVLLSCLFDTGESPIHLTELTVTWSLQGDHTIAEFQHGETFTWQGVRLFKDGLSNGNASVLIRKVTKSDAGNYRCEVGYSSETAHQQMNLQIYAKDLQVNVASSRVRVNKGNDAVLNCTFTADGPHIDLDHLEMQWLLDEKEIIRFNKIERPSRKGVRLSDVMKSDVSLVLSEVKTEDEGNYTCYVQYTPDAVRRHIYLEVTDHEGTFTDPELEAPNVEESGHEVMHDMVPETELSTVRSTRALETVSAEDLKRMTVAVLNLILQHNAELVRSMNSKNPTAAAEQRETTGLLKSHDYVLLASLVVIIAVIILIFVCSRKRHTYRVSKKESRRHLI